MNDKPVRVANIQTWIHEPFVAGRDYLGGTLPTEIINPTGDWTDYAQDPEYQTLADGDPQACTRFTILNAIEGFVRGVYNVSMGRGWSDRWFSKKSGVDPKRGSTYREGFDFIRKKGVPLEEKWPTTESMTVAEFYTEPPKSLDDDAKKDFLDIWDLGYEEIPATPESIDYWLKRGKVVTSVTAWILNPDGTYTDMDMPNGHAADVLKVEWNYKGHPYAIKVNDSYPPYIKYYVGKSQQAKRVIVNKKISTPEEKGILIAVFEALKKNGLLAFFGEFYRRYTSPPPVEQVVDPPKPMTIPLPKEHLLNSMCKAIQEYEGWHPPSGKFPEGSRSFRNKNPGNIRRIQSARVIGYDKDGFARFKTYEDGLLTLKGMILNAARGNSKVYKDTDNLRAYFAKYAPDSDGNHSVNYSNYVAKVMGVDPVLWQIRELV